MWVVLRDAARAWRGTPIVAASAVASLALALGASITFLSVTDQLGLRPLPVPRAHELYQLKNDDRGPANRSPLSVRAAVWREIATHVSLYDSAFASMESMANLARTGEAVPAEVVWASGHVFEALEVAPARGRTFGPDDDRAGGGTFGPVAVISHGFWQRRFGGRDDAIGQTIDLDGTVFSIAGIMPPRFRFEVGRTFDVVAPMATQPLVFGGFGNLYRITVRLGPSRSQQALTTALQADQARIRTATMPDYRRPQDRDNYLRTPFRLVPAADGGSVATRYFGRALRLATALALVVLLAAAGNVAALLMAHGERQRHTLAIHLSQGAPRWVTFGRVVADGLMLAGLGVVLGVGIAIVAVPRLLAEMSTVGVDVTVDRAVDLRVATGAILLALMTALASASVPAWHAAGVAPVETLKAHGGSQRHRRPFLRGLVAGQVAFSTLVVIAGGLLASSYWQLMRAGDGVQAPGLVLTELALESDQDSSSIARDLGRMRDAAREMSGVAEAAYVMTAPLQLFVQTTVVEVPGLESLPEPERMVQYNWASPGYFAAFGTRFLAGRDFTPTDGRGTRVAIVNRAFAARYLGGRLELPATVHRLEDDGRRDSLSIVGVVEDVAYMAYGVDADPLLVVPAAQVQDLVEPTRRASVVVRPVTPTSVPVEALSAVFAKAAPRMRFRTRPFDSYVARESAYIRIPAAAAAWFAGLALLLAMAGVFGMASYSVARERRELGVRLALGAQRLDIGWMVSRRMALIAAAGLAAGALAAWWLSSFLAAFMLQDTAAAWPAFAASVALLGGSLVVATIVPVRRAMSIEPIEALRTP